MDESVSRREISATVSDLGWRYVLGSLSASVRAESSAGAVQIAARLAEEAGDAAEESLRMDIRRDRLIVSLQSFAQGRVTRGELDLARRIAVTLGELGARLDPGPEAGIRSVQVIEIAVDALDIAGIRPFWRAVLGYQDEPVTTGTPDALVDPLGQGPSVWFQQMTEPRPQRNRIHLDVSVPHDETRRRIDAALAAGGTLLGEEAAPAFWVLADAESNEVCVTTWQGRD
ncbi:4a-hydroxytetrahydrobiopterin dehydratase [Amycolatopsis antarctica]|uniref:4a-hydroxytetrahydrobiopterin dehydratase n=2 Tax=Amycolatopsis antarctica TaxID=1854586 RepID=A0A263D8X5_9PSEU|nr:4a-hydroxytetrahydrobiopterin dehydratase [Amycolatopsis antarctica]